MMLEANIGGITPGSFCPAAESSFDEGISLPPVKIIEGLEIRRDIEELYLRSSRKPEMVALDFRAQMVGNTSARKRMLELIRRYGPKTVKGVMKKIISDSEKSYLEKMARLLEQGLRAGALGFSTSRQPILGYDGKVHDMSFERQLIGISGHLFVLVSGNVEEFDIGKISRETDRKIFLLKSGSSAQH